jgi:AcrR family transcriptional regulator
VPIDPAPTRQKILDTALALFAERGLDAVSLSEINRAAGQRNSSALQYHFGGREGLLRAILAPYAAAIRDRRRELIALASQPSTDDDDTPLRRAAEVLVRPQAELGAGDWRDRAMSRIVADLFTDPHHPYSEFDDLLGERATAEMAHLLTAALADLPADVRAERLRVASTFVVHAASDRARQVDAAGRVNGSADPVSPTDLFVDNLVDMVVGALSAPVSRSAAALAPRGR